MLKPYKCRTPADYKNALKEIVQQITLLGLSRQGFFNHAAFYGGSALRIAHGLNRFSEDLDFTLLSPDPDFTWTKYLKGLEEELLSYELEFSAKIKEKKSKSPIETAHIKGNTLAILIAVAEKNAAVSGTHKNELLTIKLEIDTAPPSPSGKHEVLFLTAPIPFSYRILRPESLFSGKLHAILSRDYPSGRVKGRDFYDLIWYVKKQISPDIPYLAAKLKQSGIIGNNQNVSLDWVKEMLSRKIAAIDMASARADVAPFIQDEFELNLWSIEFFTSLIRTIS
jgi:predicted nucleotidyltransferase component of viral defense system